jgi:hypothetical protein
MILMAGDFDAILNLEDSFNENTTKDGLLNFLNAGGFILSIWLPEPGKNKICTLNRTNNRNNFSQLDLILTNLPISNPTYFSKITIIDRAYVFFPPNLLWPVKGEDSSHNERLFIRL